MSWRLKSKESDSSGTLWLTATEDAFDRFDEFVNPKWLLNISNTRLRKEPLGLCIHHISCYEQETMPQGRIQRFHQTVQALPAETGHPLVANNDVIGLVFDFLEGFRSRIRKVDARPLLDENV